MTEFKAGEYKTRDGDNAVVVFELPNPHPDEKHPLVGYYCREKGHPFHARWNKNGESLYYSNDLMPRKKKIQSWGFCYYRFGRKEYTSHDTEEEAITLHSHFTNILGCTCSNVFKYVDLEVEE